MSFVDVLPTLNAGLNGTCTVLLLAGRYLAAQHKPQAHRNAMLSALGASAVFLVFYLIRFYLTGTHRFVGAPALKVIYLVILFSHMILAAVVVPLVLRSVYLGLKGQIEAHRRVVRYTFPIWLYVSVTGVVVYVMLYHLSG